MYYYFIQLFPYYRSVQNSAISCPKKVSELCFPWLIAIIVVDVEKKERKKVEVSR